MIDRALLLNPSLYWAWYFSGWVKTWLGEPETAIERHTHAIRLSPRDMHIFALQAGIAGGHFFAGRAAEALEWAKTSFRAKPDLKAVISSGYSLEIVKTHKPNRPGVVYLPKPFHIRKLADTVRDCMDGRI